MVSRVNPVEQLNDLYMRNGIAHFESYKKKNSSSACTASIELRVYNLILIKIQNLFFIQNLLLKFN